MAAAEIRNSVAEIGIKHDTREIVMRIGRPVPPQEMRASLHRLLDYALDSLAAEDAPKEETQDHG